MSEKYSFVVLKFFVCVQLICHFLALSESSCRNSALFVIFVQLSAIVPFVYASLARVAAISFPFVPACAFTYRSAICLPAFFHFIPLSSEFVNYICMCFAIFSQKSVVSLSLYIVAILSSIRVLSIISCASSIASCSLDCFCTPCLVIIVRFW
jgi:hypothetical protein